MRTSGAAARALRAKTTKVVKSMNRNMSLPQAGEHISSRVGAYAQRLERPRRRMQLGPGGALQREIARLAHDRGQLLRRRDRLELAALDDALGDRGCVRLVPQLQQRLGQLSLRKPVDERGGGL